jgi:hypothetical protein
MSMATKAAEKKAGQENIEASEGVTPEHELKAALDEPAGSTEFSGASAGIKATGDGPDTPPAYDRPKAQVAAEKQALKVADEVREIQEDVQRRNLLSNVPDYPVSVAFANRDDDGKPTGSLVFAVAGGELVVTTTGRELHFGREEAASLQRAAAKVAGSL